MGLCANMKYTLVETDLFYGSRQMVNWFGKYSACYQGKSFQMYAVHCRTSQRGSPRGFPLLWVREDASTQVSVLRVVEDHCTQGHGGRIVSMRICYNHNEFELSQGFTSVLWGVSVYCGSWRSGLTKSFADQGGRAMSMMVWYNPEPLGLTQGPLGVSFYCGSWRRGPHYCGGGGVVHWSGLVGSRVGAHCYGSLQVPILRYNGN